MSDGKVFVIGSKYFKASEVSYLETADKFAVNSKLVIALRGGEKIKVDMVEILPHGVLELMIDFGIDANLTNPWTRLAAQKAKELPERSAPPEEMVEKQPEQSSGKER